MKILKKGNSDVIGSSSEFIESIKTCGEELRFHKYILMDSTDDGNPLLYNSLTKEIVLMENGDSMFSDYFANNLWMVPQSFEDSILAANLKVSLFDTRPKKITPMSYTIVTTTGCNARCFYCYEKGVKKKTMDRKTAEDVADFIEKNYLSLPEGKRPTVSISWFGGEPLFNRKAIDTICGRLSEKNVPYDSTMISNGYLFNDKVISDALSLWNLRSVQITLDGTEEYYNKAKNYKSKDANPFKIVTDNIEKLTSNGIHVSVRVNVGFYNAEDVKSLVEFIKERYRGKGNLSVYAHALFDNGGKTDIDTEEKSATVYGEMFKMEDDIKESGFGTHWDSLGKFNGAHCMADNGRHIVIQADGGVTLCEHFVDSNRIGSIYDSAYDEASIERFREIKEPFEACYACPIYPECSSLKICEDGDIKCGEARRTYKIRRIMRAVKNIYNKSKTENI